mmetsp:Transcript_2072/g.5749  ORF Transcript_2072/g.5749 Transcript_2072/m.5749 type:complete len:310 (-) Transcript_2072:82-1011(-)
MAADATAGSRQKAALLLALAVGALALSWRQIASLSGPSLAESGGGDCSDLDFQCFSAERKRRRLDATFAGFVARASFASILEDSQVGGVDSQTGDTDKQVARGLLSEVSATYARVCRELGIESELDLGGDKGDGFPSAETLQDPRRFDAYSYAQFKAAAGRVRGQKARRALTERAGVRLLGMMREMAGVSPTGDPDDLSSMKENLEKVLHVFQEVGYVLDSGITWPEGASQEAWEATHDLTFQYWMRDPVILPSARRLFAEEGFAQHFSSRTIESVFAAYLAEAREDPHFDPRDHPDDHVVEQWTVKAY